MTTPADIGAERRRHARWFFWGLQLLGIAFSLYGNEAHALSGPQGATFNTVIAAGIAPIFLASLSHGVAQLARAAVPGWACTAVLAIVAIVAVFAFVQSFGALDAFARGSGVLAPRLTPLIVDLTIGASTFALVALGDASATADCIPRPAAPSPRVDAGTAIATLGLRRRSRVQLDREPNSTTVTRGAGSTPQAAESAPAELDAASTATPYPELHSATATRELSSAPQTAASASGERDAASAAALRRELSAADATHGYGPQPASIATAERDKPVEVATSAGQWLAMQDLDQLAAELVRDTSIRRDVKTVRIVLAGYANGDPVSRIAWAAACHHSVVKRIIDEVAARRFPALADSN
jgi:hypothetical protein